MWVLKFVDGKHSALLLREYIFEGRVLAFEYEEQALRFCRQIIAALSAALGVGLSVMKLHSDPKKERLVKVPAISIDKTARAILRALE